MEISRVFTITTGYDVLLHGILMPPDYAIELFSLKAFLDPGRGFTETP